MYRPTGTAAQRRAIALLCALLAWASGARADDTEVFVATAADNPEAGRANILFIIDTSASMDADTETQVPWNASATFDGCYRSDAVYFGTGAQPPPCDSDAFILKTANRCAASAGTLAALGQYGAYALGWDAARERWDPLVAGDPERILECEADRGEDGAGSERFAANGPEGPWGPDDSAEPAWNTQYTLFDGNWLNWRANPPTVVRSRIEIVQEVVTDIVRSIDGVNVGLMQFNRQEGGTVTQAVADIATSRQAMIDAVAGLRLLSGTPLSETLYEAALYLRGGNVDYGNVGPIPSVPDARIGGSATGTQYRSPVTAQCQKNFIILLTDGEPTGDVSANAKITALPGFDTLVGACDGGGDGACLDDLAEYLFRSDADATLDGQQNVTTYTIGFAVDAGILASTARRGGGEYYLADDTGSLAAVLGDIVAGIAERSATFTAPAIPANTFNRSATERDVFVSLFQPSGTAHWPGNLKKYRFVENRLVGQDGEPAVDDDTGFFSTEAFSFWSVEPDGDRVRDGGAASRLPAPSARRLYTDVAGPDLSATANRVEVANTAITPALLGVTAASRDELVRWIRGADLADLDGDADVAEPRRQMGDPLHVRPVTLDYGVDATDVVVFTSTNDGYLHAVDADTGAELWAYLPGRLLSRQAELFLDAPASTRRYGLDGELRLHVDGNDGRPGLGGSERAILLFGMGRGGDAVFALDVTARSAPRLLWSIDRSSPGFERIGQVWDAPEVTRVAIGGSVRSVVALTGGYDDSQDNRGYRIDGAGNAVFLVDLLTGERLWSAGPPGAGHDLELPAMTNSIPAAPRVIDLTRDGLADRMYVGDMGGRLWRFDIVNGNEPADLVSAGVLASLGAADLADPPASAVRRFYNTPDVVLVNCLRNNFLAINIGSGYRGHPLDTDVEDNFFSVRDTNVFVPIATADYPAPVTVGDLQDITDFPEAVVPRDAAGWRLRLAEDPGEKVLSEAITFDNTIFFTTFAPGGAVSTCVGGLGVNRLYEVDACNGRPVNNLDGSTEPGPLGVDDRWRTLNQAGIAPGPAFLFPAATAGPPTGCVGLECFPPGDDAGRRLRRTFWSQQQAADGE
jgi:type IV pilus assembly protein PilY1